MRKFLKETPGALYPGDILPNQSIKIEKNYKFWTGVKRDFLPDGRLLITRFKAKSRRGGTLVYFWQYVDGDYSHPTPDFLKELVDNIGVGDRIPSYKVTVRDNNMPAYTLLVPRYWMYNGFVNTTGELVLRLQDKRRSTTLNMFSADKYFYIDYTWHTTYIGQSPIIHGYQYAPYTNVVDYITRILDTPIYSVIDTSPPRLLSPYIRGALTAKSTGLWGNIESKIIVSRDKILWTTIYGYQLSLQPMISPILWNIHTAVIEGPRNLELLKSLLLSIISHIQLNPLWAKRKIYEAHTKTISSLKSIISDRVGYIPLPTRYSRGDNSYSGNEELVDGLEST